MLNNLLNRNKNKEEIEELTNKIQSLNEEMEKHNKMLRDDINILLDKEKYGNETIHNTHIDLQCRYYRIREICDEIGYFRGKIECLRRG